MRGFTKIVIGIGIAGATTVAAAFCNMSFLQEHAGGSVLWHTGEAYVFAGYGQEGLHVSYLRYPWFLFENFLYTSGDAPDDFRGVLEVIRVTPAGLERHTLISRDRSPGSGLGEFTPMNGRVYANDRSLGGLCRWTGDHFEPAMQDEKRRLDEVGGLANTDFDNRDGWSRRAFGPTQGEQKFVVNLGNDVRLQVDALPIGRSGNGAVTIDVMRPDHAPERIWDFSACRGRVSKGEYGRIFRRKN